MRKSKHRTRRLFGLRGSIGKFIVDLGDIRHSSNPALRCIFDGVVQKNSQAKAIEQNKYSGQLVGQPVYHHVRAGQVQPDGGGEDGQRVI